MQITTFIQRWANFKPLELQVKALDDNLIIESNQNKLEEGIYPDGEEFREYSQVTLAIKRAKGGFISSSGRLALKDSGSFYNSMFVRKEPLFAELNATDSKTDKLVAEFSDRILDIPQDAHQEIVDESRDRFIDMCKKDLGL
jgi:hypothetical protein